MLKRSLLPGFIAMTLMVASFAFAADKEVTNLEEIVVTATRTEQTLATAPGTVDVVTKKGLEKRNVKTVDSALNTLPGVFDRRQSLMDTLSAVSLHGIPDQKRTLVLLDGVPLNSAYDGSVGYTGLPLEDVERIEVVQGPFSSLYGGYAMGGVVNVISKFPEKREFFVKSGYGSSWHRGESYDDMKKYYVSYGDKLFGKLGMQLSYGYKATNGFAKDLNVQSKEPTGLTGWSHTETNQGAPRYLIGDKGDNTWWDDSIGVKAGYDFSPVSKLRASFLRTRYEYGYDDPHTYLRNATGDPVYAYGTVRESSYLSGEGGKETNIYALSYETEIGIAKTKLSFGVNDVDESWYTTPGTTAATTRGGGPGKVSKSPNHTYNTDLQITVPLFSRHILTFGGAYKYDSAHTEEFNLTDWKDEDSETSRTYVSGGRARTYSLFVQDEIAIFDTLTAYVGFRQDWWEAYDGYADQIGSAGYPQDYDSRKADSFSPKAALVYKPFTVTTLRASVGRAFRPPTVYELYRTWTGSTGIVYNGNPELDPETVTSWDVGIVQGLWKGATFRATYFENYMEDLIYRKTVSSTQQDYINAGKAKSTGTTVELEQRIDPWARLFANFTYTDARIKDNDAKPETKDKRLLQIPDKMFNVGLEATAGPVSGSVTGRYVAKRYGNDENLDTTDDVYGSYDSFFTVDAKVSWKIASFATASFSVDNLFNKEHYEYYRAPGRSWFGEVALSF